MSLAIALIALLLIVAVFAVAVAGDRRHAGDDARLFDDDPYIVDEMRRRSAARDDRSAP